jgi:CubicO group peptidase (beta-lactamase class C family)
MINIDLNNYINKHATGYVIKTANLNNKPFEVSTYVTGNAEIFPNTIKMTEKHLFDIASLTKVFTAICIFKAVEKKMLKLEDIIKNADDRFVNLDKVSILDLLAHRVEIWTDGYLGDAISKEDFYKRLFNSKVKKYDRCYVDAHFMILSIILEKIYKLSFDKIIDQEINVPLELKNTTFNPEYKDSIVSNNYGLVGDKMVEDAYPGVIHDTKARVAKKYGIYVGHAGIFTTAEDLFKVLMSFIDEKELLLKKDTINKMISHDNINEELFKSMMQYANQNDISVTSINLNNMYEEILDKCSNPDNFFEYVFRSYNYMSTRFKNPIKAKNDVPEMASDNTIVFSGYTGPGFLIDFDRKIVILVMSNVCHMSKLNREERKKLSLEIMTKLYEIVHGDVPC